MSKENDLNNNNTNEGATKVDDSQLRELLVVLVATLFLQDFVAPGNESLESFLYQLRCDLFLPDPDDLLLEALLGCGHGVFEDMVLHHSPHTEVKHR